MTLLLLRGPSENVVPLYPIVEKIENTGTYTWTPAADLEPDTSRYGIQLIQDADGAYQWSTQFGIGGDAPSESSSTTEHPSSTDYLSSTEHPSSSDYLSSTDHPSSSDYLSSTEHPSATDLPTGSPSSSMGYNSTVHYNETATAYGTATGVPHPTATLGSAVSHNETTAYTFQTSTAEATDATLIPSSPFGSDAPNATTLPLANAGLQRAALPLGTVVMTAVGLFAALYL